MLGPLQVAQTGNRIFSSAGQRLPGQNKPAWIAIRQRMQNHRIEDAEHRRVGADAERQGQDRGDAESRLLR